MATVVVAVSAAGPSIVRALSSPSFIADDFTLLLLARRDGIRGFLSAPDLRARPFQAILDWAQFTVLGSARGSARSSPGDASNARTSRSLSLSARRRTGFGRVLLR